MYRIPPQFTQESFHVVILPLFIYHHISITLQPPPYPLPSCKWVRRTETGGWQYNTSSHKPSYQKTVKVKHSWESHLVIEFDPLQCGVIKVKPLELEGQQLGKVGKPEALGGKASGRDLTQRVSNCKHMATPNTLPCVHHTSFGTAHTHTGCLHSEPLALQTLQELPPTQNRQVQTYVCTHLLYRQDIRT